MAQERVNWDYFNQFENFTDLYLPARGEGTNMATQAVTAVTKLVYKWYNDGDVFDNTYCLGDCGNDLSTFANWLANHISGCADILNQICKITTGAEYEHLLKDLADYIFDFELLRYYEEQEKTGSIYTCKGVFKFEEYEEDEDYWEWDDDEEDE